MIQAIDLTLRHADGTLALDAFNLKVGPGEIHCLLGATGAGKSTVVDLFLGLHRPSAGKALIDGIDVSGEPAAAKARVAFFGASTTFYPRLTTMQNLEFFVGLGRRRPPGRLDCRMALREVGLPESFFDRRLGEIAPGGVRKLGLAIALLKNTPAVILDEPLSGLDPKVAAEVVETLVELRGKGRAILVTLQDLFWVNRIADSVGILKEGRQTIHRTRDELRYEELEQLYLGDALDDSRASSPLDRSPFY